MTRVDVIVAVRNEKATIAGFLAAIAALPLPADVSCGVIFVEDSSTDGTKALLRQLARTEPRVQAYLLAKGQGQGPALAFGLARSGADAMILMDVDGSHPVATIAPMIEAFREGARIVQCRRRSLANRSLYRRAGSALFFQLTTMATGVNLEPQTIYFRLVSADVARWILRSPRYWQFLRFPLERASGGALRFIDVDTHERTAGESKYGPLRLARLAVDGMLSVMTPARLAILTALLLLAGLALLFTPARIAAVVPLLAAAAAVRRYRQLDRRALLDEMALEEQTDSPQRSSSPTGRG